MLIPTTIAVDDASVSAVASTFLSESLPAVAVIAVLMALICLACTVCGAYSVILGARHLTTACPRCVRRCRRAQCRPLATLHSDRATTKVINLDRYRRRCRQHPSRHTRRLRPDCDEPA